MTPTPTQPAEPTWARDEAYRLVCENSWGWEESASDELTRNQEQHVEWLAGELAKIVSERLPLADAGEVGRLYAIGLPFDRARIAYRKSHDGSEPSDNELFVWTLLQWEASKRLLESHEPDGRNVTNRQFLEERQARLAAQSALEAAERERDEWNRQHTAAEQRLAEVTGALEGASTVWKEADDELLSEHRARQDEAEKWKAEGDMYAWNFPQGMANGMTSASIIFARVKRFIDAALKEQADGPKTQS